MTEQRRRPRVRVDSAASIVTKTGNPVACRIRDRSEDGARLLVDSVLGIPNQFRLIVRKTGEEFPATVVWRGPQEIGVAFIEAQGLLSATPPARPARPASPIDIPLGPDIGLVAPEIGATSPLCGSEEP